jgi:hypothetical protein
MTAGHGGIVAVSGFTGIGRSTIGRGLKDLAANEEALSHKRVRRTVIKIPKAALKVLNIKYDDFHDDWNCASSPIANGQPVSCRRNEAVILASALRRLRDDSRPRRVENGIWCLAVRLNA